MKRLLVALVLGGALLAFGPATALAAKHHHHGHHARHHSRVRFERFGRSTAPTGSASQGNAHNAGMVTSFQNGTLTITLNDGSTVSGKVTPDTEIECKASATSNTMQRDDHGRDNGDRGDDNGNDNGDDNDNDNAEHEHNCSTADLQPGTVVREAELKVSGAGATWDKVELVTSQTGDNNNDNDNDDS